MGDTSTKSDSHYTQKLIEMKIEPPNTQNNQDPGLQTANRCSPAVLRPASCCSGVTAKVGVLVAGVALGVVGISLVSGCNGGALSDPATVQDTATHATWQEAPVDEAPSSGSVSQAADLQETEPVWQDNLPQALALAAEVNKPILLQFTASWCGPCRVMNATVWPDQQVQAALAKHAIPVKIDIDEAANREVVQLYGIRSIPTILLIDGNGNELTRGGFMSAEALAKFINPS